MTASSVINPSCKDHLLLLYEDEDRLDEEAAQIMNEALKRGRLCIYATVHASDRDHMSRILGRIHDFEGHGQEGNLVVIDFEPFYDAMLQGNLTLFRQLKQDLEEKVRSRHTAGKSPSAIIVADCAGSLSKHGRFDRSVTLEDWWQDTYLEWQRNGVDIAVICPHPGSVLRQPEFSRELAKLSRAHSLTLDIMKSQSISYTTLQNTVSLLPIGPSHAPIRILVVEPEPDIRALYRSYLNYQGITLTTAGDGAECLKYVNANGRHEGSAFDMIILDWHLRDIAPLSVIKQIREKIPDQRIVVTFTDLHGRKKELEETGFEVLEKPFRFAQLLSLIRPKTARINKIGLTDHVLAFYDNEEEELQEAFAFITSAIRNNETALFVIRKGIDVDDLKSRMSANGIEVDKLLSTNALILMRNEDWYIPDKRVDKKRIIAQWYELVDRCVSNGTKGLKAFCMMDCFFENNFAEDVIDYEHTLPAKFDIPFVPICAYRQHDIDMLSEDQLKRLSICHNHIWTGRK